LAEDLLKLAIRYILYFDFISFDSDSFLPMESICALIGLLFVYSTTIQRTQILTLVDAATTNAIQGAKSAANQTGEAGQSFMNKNKTGEAVKSLANKTGETLQRLIP
jgi:hypothetical protein